MSTESSSAANTNEMNQILRIIISISKYNKKKAIALFKSIEKRLISQKCLTLLNKETANLYMKLMTNISVFNRLLIETSIDALQNEIEVISFEDVHNALWCLAGSRFPTNRSFVLKAIKKVNK
jgi:hypothetical protein